MEYDHTNEKVCANCGKVFKFSWYNEEDYVFKRNDKYFCGFKCTREYDKNHVRRRNVRKD